MVAAKAVPGDTWETYEILKTYGHATKYSVTFFKKSFTFFLYN